MAAPARDWRVLRPGELGLLTVLAVIDRFVPVPRPGAGAYEASAEQVWHKST